MSYRTILVVINEHTGSTVAARYALPLAESEECRLVLYSAYGEGGDSTAIRLTEKHLDHLLKEAIALGINVTRVTEIGSITKLLPHRALAEAVDLLLYPLTPGEHYGSTMQQQTAHHLLRTIRADLAVMRIMHMGKPHPHRIMVPVGMVISDRKQRVRFVAALAKCFHSQVTLFHRPDVGKQGLPDDFVTLRNELRQYDLPVLERSAPGHIARAIALEAVSHHDDLIVLGASERGTLRRIFFGNPAGDVMKHPPCNTILFRPAPR
ncbi:MAG: universal stress protein [Deltaproteobacteria bacterium]|jgi:nucleotide-binding universal stress UspA family protein|nr:universal stress protein [Deltaproteobacteria bacterium]